MRKPEARTSSVLNAHNQYGLRFVFPQAAFNLILQLLSFKNQQIQMFNEIQQKSAFRLMPIVRYTGSEAFLDLKDKPQLLIILG